MFGLRKAAPGGAHRVSENIGKGGTGYRRKVERGGMITGTKVATQHGWCDVTKVALGDRVLTFDGGLQPVQSIRQDRARTVSQQGLLEVPAGALGNRETVFLLTTQNVMIESDTAEELFDDPFALVPALALEGIRGIKRVGTSENLHVVTLEFAQDQVVFANLGALFLCPRKKATDLVAMSSMGASPYKALPMSQASLLVDALVIEDVEGPQAQKHFAA